jgi:hypothetical protein
MPTPTYVPLATYTVTGSADASVDFVSIPATYRDLILVIGNMTSTAANTLYVRLNGDTGSNYSYVFANGNGSSPSSNSSSSTAAGLLAGALIGIPSGTNTTTVMQLMDYSATDKHKTSLARYNNSAGEVAMVAARWANNTAVNSMTVRVAPSGSFNVGSTFSLYGIVA